MSAASWTREQAARRLGAEPEQVLRLWLAGVPTRPGDLDAIAVRLRIDPGRLAELWGEVGG